MTIRPRSERWAPERILSGLGLAAASIDAAVIPVARLTHFVTARAVVTVVLTSAGVLAALFILALTDPANRRAVDLANRQMRGDKPFRWWIPVFDPRWGAFGSQWGSGYLVLVRTILGAEFILALISNGSRGLGLTLLLATCGFGTSILLSLIQLKAHYAPADRPSLR